MTDNNREEPVDNDLIVDNSIIGNNNSADVNIDEDSDIIGEAFYKPIETPVYYDEDQPFIPEKDSEKDFDYPEGFPFASENDDSAPSGKGTSFIKKHKLLIIFAAAAGVLIIALCVIFIGNDVIFDNGEPEDNVSVTEEETVSEPVIPETPYEISSFYAGAVKRITENGAAGYDCKKWQNSGNINVTGIEIIDNYFAKNVFESFIPESDAETVTYISSTAEAMAAFPAYTLTDTTYITEATCNEENGVYNITLRFADEDTPNEGTGILGSVSQNILFYDRDIEPMLTGFSKFVSFEDVHLYYSGYTVNCRITPDGRFVNLTHKADVRLEIASAKAAFIPVSDLSFEFSIGEQYSSFLYY